MTRKRLVKQAPGDQFAADLRAMKVNRLVPIVLVCKECHGYPHTPLERSSAVRSSWLCVDCSDTDRTVRLSRYEEYCREMEMK